MSLDSDSKPYRVETLDSGYAVMREGNHEELRCADKASAEQYALMLNKAYTFGFKAGRRSAR